MTEAEPPAQPPDAAAPADDLRERLEDELLEAQKMEAIGKLVSGIAHELNNPLAAILGFSQLIARDERLPAELRDDAQLLVQEARRTKQIVDTLLEFARRRPAEREPAKLGALVKSVLDLQTYVIGARRIDVHVDIPADLPAIPIDRSRMQQLLLTLIQNAIESIQSHADSGRITITAAPRSETAGPTIGLTVVDDGPGVPPEQRERIFEPFFTTKPPGTATGIGLTVARRIARDHGGELRVEAGLGERGATFVVELPLTPNAPHRPGARGPGAGPGKPAPAAPELTDKPRVLVIDDEPSIGRFLGKALSVGGFATVVVANGHEALEVAGSTPVAAVLCDNRMADMSGLEVYDALVAVRPELAERFVLMSGDVNDPELVDFAERRGVRLLAKPFDIPSVTQVVRSAVGREGDAGD